MTPPRPGAPRADGRPGRRRSRDSLQEARLAEDRVVRRHTAEHPIVRVSRRSWPRWLILVAALLAAATLAFGVSVAAARPRPPAAEAPALTVAAGPGVTVDWTRGVVVARGVGPADRHAPSPAVARVAAERRAIDQARARLTAAVETLPRTGPELSPAAREAVAREIGRAPVVARDFGTDGSVTVDVGLGLEAVRQAIAGPRTLAAGADDGAAVTVVLDGRDAGVRPVLGLTVGDGQGGPAWSGPIGFAAAPPEGAGASRKVSRATAGVLTVDGSVPPAGARVVVVVTP